MKRTSTRKARICRICTKVTFNVSNMCSNCERLNKTANDNRPNGYDTPAPKPSHTPGPWEIADWNPQLVRTASGAKGQWIATLHDQATRKRGNKEPDLGAMVNARLIAAAPEMLEALRCFTKEIDLSKLNVRKHFSLINAHACATNAIYKAEGRSVPNNEGK